MHDLKIVVAGCMAKQTGETLLRRVPEVDIIMGAYVPKCHYLFSDGSVR